MSASELSLAEGFAPAARAEWLALVEKTLKGAGVETLVSKGPDGVAIKPLYDETLAQQGFAPAPRDGTRPWDLRARVRIPSPVAARDAAIEELAGGASSLVIAIDSGAGGVSVGSAEALAQLLDEVQIDIAPLALDAGFVGPKAADWLSTAAKGSPAAPLAFHIDPLSAFALQGESPGPIESHLIAAAHTAARLAPVHPKATQFLASGFVVHETGGGPAQELAFALAAALSYAKALTGAGQSMGAAWRAIVLGLVADSDPLISIAKLRAARLLWATLAGACGAPVQAVIEVRSSRRMLTKAQPWTNLVRLTAAGFASVVGGADAIVLGAFTDALGLPTRFARRLSRNIQMILMEEGHLGAVADPAAGSGAFETITRDLARLAWAEFNAIEAKGGLLAALRDGLIAKNARTGRAELASALANGALRVVGVTDFCAADAKTPAIDEAPDANAPAPDARLPGPDSHCPALAPISLEDLA